MGWLDLLKGEIITISNFDLALTAATLAVVLVVLGLFQKELLLVSFDRAMAVTLGKKVWFWDLLLYLLIGLTVSMAVLSVGPLISFGFLLIPRADGAFVRKEHAPIRNSGLADWRRHRRSSDFWIAYQWDCPIGPTDVVLLGIIYALGFAVKKLASVFQSKSKR